MNAPFLLPPQPATVTPLPAAADPSRDIRTGTILAVLFFVVFLGWAAFAHLDAAAYAPGQLVVSGQRQAVQHREGGVVSRILVREGQRVQKGQLLIELAGADVRAQERALASQAVRLLAQRARLEAEEFGRPSIATPPEFAEFSGDDREAAMLALKLQESEFRARAASLSAQRSALDARAAQSGDQGRGYGQQVVSAKEQLRLIDEQINSLRPLADKGFVSQTRMRDLERARAEMQGQGGQYQAGVAQTANAARESELQRIEAERTFREHATAELREVDTQLGDVLPKWTAARDQLRRTSIVAPATGAVVGLTAFTPGGVIAPGQKLMDIVPERMPLVVQAKIAPDDADDLHVGQRALVKFSGLHERTLPNLEGTITRLSADSLTDERNGQSYFTGDIVVPYDQVNLIREVRGKQFDLLPGMPAQVLIPLRKRTALDYALEPLFGTFWASFREH